MYLPPPSTLPPGSIVDSYRRDSGGMRQDQSTDQQLAEIQAFCAKHSLTLRNNFVDEAKSGGSTAGRDDFNRMIDHYRVPDQRPHGLILWNYARFARDFDNAVYYKSLIRTYKIIIHSLNDQIPEGDYGRIVEFFIDMSNEEKRRQTSADAKRGLRDLVQKYGCVPGTPPMGFKRTPVKIGLRRDGSDHVAHRWDPDPKLKHRIQQAFEMRAARSTLKQIHTATRLYSSLNSYKTFFTNRIYIGILEFGDIVIEDYCKPIIDISTWDAVQKLVTQYAQARTTERHPKRANSPYLLSGLLYCAQCDSPMNGNTVSRRSHLPMGEGLGVRGKDEAYRCSRSKRHAGCTAGRISRHSIETAVLDSLKDFVLVPENLEAIHRLALQAQADFETKRIDRTESLTAERSKVANQIVNITKAIADKGHSQVLLDKLTDLEAQRAQIKAELNNLSIPLATTLTQPDTLPPYSKEHFAAVSQGFLNLLQHGTQEQIKTFVQGYVHKVTAERIGKEIRGTITYYYPPIVSPPNTPPGYLGEMPGGQRGSPFESAPTSGTMLPISSAPVGAPTYRQQFTIPFVYQSKRPRS